MQEMYKYGVYCYDPMQTDSRSTNRSQKLPTTQAPTTFPSKVISGF